MKTPGNREQGTGNCDTPGTDTVPPNVGASEGRGSSRSEGRGSSRLGSSVARCPLPVALHVSEPKWGDEPEERERFEERKAYDFATMGILFLLLVVAAAVVLVWYTLVSTVEPGVDQHRQIQEITR